MQREFGSPWTASIHISDFASAIKKAAKRNIVGVRIRHCFFHFVQIISRLVMEQRKFLIDNYGIEFYEKVYDEGMMLSCLALVKRDDVIPTYNATKEMLTEQTRLIVGAHIEENYLRESGNGYLIDEWNVNDCLMSDVAMTNSQGESFNATLNQFIPRKSPPIYDLLRIIDGIFKQSDLDFMNLNSNVAGVCTMNKNQEKVRANWKEIVDSDRLKGYQLLEALNDVRIGRKNRIEKKIEEKKTLDLRPVPQLIPIRQAVLAPQLVKSAATKKKKKNVQNVLQATLARERMTKEIERKMRDEFQNAQNSILKPSVINQSLMDNSLSFDALGQPFFAQYQNQQNLSRQQESDRQLNHYTLPNTFFDRQPLRETALNTPNNIFNLTPNPIEIIYQDSTTLQSHPGPVSTITSGLYEKMNTSVESYSTINANLPQYSTTFMPPATKSSDLESLIFSHDMQKLQEQICAGTDENFQGNAAKLIKQEFIDNALSGDGTIRTVTTKKKRKIIFSGKLDKSKKK